MWAYVIAPIIGSVLASIFHWKTVTYRRKMKYDNEIEEKRLKHTVKRKRLPSYKMNSKSAETNSASSENESQIWSSDDDQINAQVEIESSYNYEEIPELYPSSSLLP